MSRDLYPPVLPSAAERARPKRPIDAKGTVGASFVGTCPCSREIAKGDRIVQCDGSWYHEECRP